MKTTRTIRDYNTARAIGEIEMSDTTYRKYENDADEYTGAILVSDLHYGHIEWSDIPTSETTVYIEQ